MVLRNTISRIFASSLLLLLMHSASQAQSFNIDVDLFNSPPEVGGGAPSPTFAGAAGQVGFWNAYPDNFNGPFQLRTTSGALTGAILTASGTGSSGGWNNPINTGDYALLLNDAQNVGSNLSYTFSGLLPGRYFLYTYGVPPNSEFGEIFTTVSGSLTQNPQHASGTMPGNQFILGRTHTVHELLVVNGTLQLGVQGPWPNAYVSGFQLVAVPEPATALGCFVGCLILVRKRRTRP